ncbi:hypothetical protein [Escherichia phage dw-ec]|nr:hypothetical protein [Escherichia phage dw-ec]
MILTSTILMIHLRRKNAKTSDFCKRCRFKCR